MCKTRDGGIKREYGERDGKDKWEVWIKQNIASKRRKQVKQWKGVPVKQPTS